MEMGKTLRLRGETREQPVTDMDRGRHGKRERPTRRDRGDSLRETQVQREGKRNRVRGAPRSLEVPIVEKGTPKPRERGGSPTPGHPGDLAQAEVDKSACINQSQ